MGQCVGLLGPLEGCGLGGVPPAIHTIEHKPWPWTRQGPGSQRLREGLRPLGLQGRRRGLPAFQELLELALHLLLRETCAALRDQLAGPVDDGVQARRSQTAAGPPPDLSIPFFYVSKKYKLLNSICGQ